jgi:hypothetical protein
MRLQQEAILATEMNGFRKGNHRSHRTYMYMCVCVRKKG